MFFIEFYYTHKVAINSNVLDDDMWIYIIRINYPIFKKLI